MKRQVLWVSAVAITLFAITAVGRDFNSTKCTLQTSIDNILKSLSTKTEIIYLLELQKIIEMKPMLDSMCASCPDSDLPSIEKNLLEKSNYLFNEYSSHPYLNPLYAQDQSTLKDYIVPVTMLFQIFKNQVAKLKIPTTDRQDSLNVPHLSKPAKRIHAKELK